MNRAYGGVLSGGAVRERYAPVDDFKFILFINCTSLSYYDPIYLEIIGGQKK